MKKLYKSKDNKIFFGVIGGIGEYIDMDPVILRLVLLLLILITAIIPGTIFYIIAGLIVPQKPNKKEVDK